MRFVVLFLLLGLPVTAFAAADKSPVQPYLDPATVKKAVSEAARQSPAQGLQDEKGNISSASAAIGPPIKWIDVAPVTRQAIVHAWLQLDPLTRPPFPLFFAQWMRPQTAQR